MNQLVAHISNPQESRTGLSHGRTILTRIAATVGNAFEADVCSVYELDPEQRELVLVATVGLRQRAVGKIRMRTNEGLVGLVADEAGPISITHAQLHSRFKYFPDAGEEPYDSFLGVPIGDDTAVAGVLVVQSIDDRQFSEAEQQRLILLGRSLLPVMVAMENRQRCSSELPACLVEFLSCLHDQTAGLSAAVSLKNLTERARRMADTRIVLP